MIDLDTADLGRLEVLMETDKGSMLFGFYPDQAPGHVKNFFDLAQKGFYDGLAFHRIVRNFMVQGGCPNTREGETGIPGTGGPGYQIAAEFSDVPHKRGVLSMARSQDPNSAGSQFFLVHAEHAPHLDGQYTVFGFMKEGFDVLDEIAGVAVDHGPGGERSAPTERVGIVTLTLREAPPEEEPEAEATEDAAPQSAGADAEPSTESNGAPPADAADEATAAPLDGGAE